MSAEQFKKSRKQEQKRGKKRRSGFLILISNLTVDKIQKPKSVRKRIYSIGII